MVATHFWFGCFNFCLILHLDAPASHIQKVKASRGPERCCSKYLMSPPLSLLTLSHSWQPPQHPLVYCFLSIHQPTYLLSSSWLSQAQLHDWKPAGACGRYFTPYVVSSFPSPGSHPIPTFPVSFSPSYPPTNLSFICPGIFGYIYYLFTWGPKQLASFSSAPC